VYGHKFLEDVHEDSMQVPSQNNQFLCNRPDGTLKSSGRPAVSSSLLWRCPDDRATPSGWLGQSVFNTELDFRSRHCKGSLCKSFGWHGNTFRHCPTFQNNPVFCSNTRRSYSKGLPDARPSHLNVDLIRIELCYFWKDIAEDNSDVANFRSDARQPESESQQF
jgi:hypothetical protein